MKPLSHPVHPAEAGHPVHPSHPVAGHPAHHGVLNINDIFGNIGGRSSGPISDLVGRGYHMPAHSGPISDLAGHLGRHPAIHLAANRLQHNKAANPHELTWVADHHAHPLPAHHNPSRPPIHIPGSDLGTIAGRSGLSWTSISLHHTTPGGAWWQLNHGAEQAHIVALEEAHLNSMLDEGKSPHLIAHQEQMIAGANAGKIHTKVTDSQHLPSR